MQEAKRVRVGEIEMEFGEWGQGERPFVLVHGFTGSRDDWREVGPKLAGPGRRVVAPDLRGHGGTSNPGRPDAYSFDLLAQDLVGFLDALGIGRCDLLGHSMGGSVALRATLAAPERVASLVLMDTSAEAFRGTAPEIYEMGARIAREQGMGKLFEAARGMWNQDLPPSVQKLQAKVGSEAYFERIRAKFCAMDAEAFAALGPALLEQSGLIEHVAAISCPTLVLVGEEDRNLLGAAENLARTIPEAEHVVISDAAHSPQVENQGAWLAAVRAHLERAQA